MRKHRYGTKSTTLYGRRFWYEILVRSSIRGLGKPIHINGLQPCAVFTNAEKSLMRIHRPKNANGMLSRIY